MKYRQAKKICKGLGLCSIGYNSPTIDKAIVVFVHHRKKDHDYYEKRRIPSGIREFYEKKRL